MIRDRRRDNWLIAVLAALVISALLSSSAFAGYSSSTGQIGTAYNGMRACRFSAVNSNGIDLPYGAAKAWVHDSECSNPPQNAVSSYGWVRADLQKYRNGTWSQCQVADVPAANRPVHSVFVEAPDIGCAGGGTTQIGNYSYHEAWISGAQRWTFYIVTTGVS